MARLYYQEEVRIWSVSIRNWQWYDKIERCKSWMFTEIKLYRIISVEMLTYLYEGDFTNDDRWELLENYFLGVILDKIKHDCRQERPDIIFDWPETYTVVYHVSTISKILRKIAITKRFLTRIYQFCISLFSNFSVLIIAFFHQIGGYSARKSIFITLLFILSPVICTKNVNSGASVRKDVGVQVPPSAPS